MIIKLDLRVIIGNVTFNTPYIVIKELIERTNHKFCEEKKNDYRYMLKILTIIDEFEYRTIDVKEISTSLEYQKLCKKFVNRNVEKWHLDNLIKALKHMFCFEHNCDFEYGDKTDDKVYNYSTIMMYKICLDKNITVDKNITIDELYNICKYSMFTLNSLKDIVISKFSAINDKSAIISLIKDIDHSQFLSEEITYKSLKKTYDNMNWLNSECNNKKEAIIIAATKYFKNIVYSNNPYIELEKLKKDEVFIPFDEKFKDIYLKNPDWFDVKKTWQRELSFIYKDPSMIKFIQSESISLEDNTENLYDILVSTRDDTNIYDGIHPLCKNDKTMIYMENINDINKDLILTIGSVTKDNLEYITPRELADVFLNNKHLKDPLVNTSSLKSSVIKKLKAICTCKMSNSIIIDDYRFLLSSIDEIISLSKILTIKAKDIINYKCEELEKILDAIIELAFAMRGKNVVNVEGILVTNVMNNLDMRFDPEGFEQIYVNVNIKYLELQSLIDSIPSSLRLIIKDLNLVSFEEGNEKYRLFNRDVTKKFKISNDKLFKYIDNILKTDDIEGCIRTTSNFVLSSAIFYSTLCGYRTDLNIDDIRDIR